MRHSWPRLAHQTKCAHLAALVAGFCLSGCLEKLPKSAFGVADTTTTSDASNGKDDQVGDVAATDSVDPGEDTVSDGAITGDTTLLDVVEVAETADDAASDVEPPSDGVSQQDTESGADAPDSAGLDADGATSPDSSGTACVPNATSCIGNVVAHCDTAGAKLTPGEDCDNTGKTCKDGACVSPQAGFAGHGGFINAPTTNGGGFRVTRQGFGSREVCGAGYCVRGGLRP